MNEAGSWQSAVIGKQEKIYRRGHRGKSTERIEGVCLRLRRGVRMSEMNLGGVLRGDA